MKINAAYYSTTGMILLTLTCTSYNAMALPGYGGNVDSQCANLVYPLDQLFEPQVAGDCFACHDNGPSGGSGAGATAYKNENYEFFCPAPTLNISPVAEVNGPYMGEEGQSISFSSLGSTDSDGSIVSIMWEFGDGNSSSEINPTHAYTVASEYTVSLTVMDDAGDTDMSTTTATILTPPSNDPDIHLKLTDFDFGNIEVGTTESRTTAIENTGTQMLDITSIMSCSGTSDEFSMSPSTSFSVTPGASHTVTVSYAPIDDIQDEGCIEVANNDPDENPVKLQLTGSGYVPQPQMLDLDIAGLRVIKRVSLKRVKTAKVMLVVKNTGTIEGNASATLIGTQNGVEVHNVGREISLAVGERARIKFPSYTPTEMGNIQWSVTINDEDPDVDEAMAVTRIVK